MKYIIEVTYIDFTSIEYYVDFDKKTLINKIKDMSINGVHAIVIFESEINQFGDPVKPAIVAHTITDENVMTPEKKKILLEKLGE